jgi:hypothetical protein
VKATQEIDNEVVLSLTVTLNVPSIPVVVPLLEPLAVTDAPCTGIPLSSSTVPVITFVWENANCVNVTHNKRTESLFSNRVMVIINGLKQLSVKNTQSSQTLTNLYKKYS